MVKWSFIIVESDKFIDFIFSHNHIAIDAAGPGYTIPKMVDASRRIDSTDCERVIVLCCNKKIISSDRILGDINIFVNNDAEQPPNKFLSAIFDHAMCPNYLTDSLRKNRNCNFTMINSVSNTSYVFDVNSILKYPNGNYTMNTSTCYPNATVN